MTENQKRPIWPLIDDKEIEAGRRKLIEEIGALKARIVDYDLRMKTLGDGKGAPSMKAHFATLYQITANHIDFLETTLSLANTLADFSNQLALVLQSLDKQIQEISEKTHVDLTQIKTEVAQVRETVNAPILRYLKEQKEADERIRKSGEETFDQLTRSH